MGYKDINQKLNARIEELGLKKSFLARRFGISPPYFYDMLNGKSRISRDTFLELVGYLGLNSKDLKREFPLDFDREWNISAYGFRPRDKKIR